MVHEVVRDEVQLLRAPVELVVVTVAEETRAALLVHVRDDVLAATAGETVVHCVLRTCGDEAEGRNDVHLEVAAEVRVERTVHVREESVGGGLRVGRGNEPYAEHVGGGEEAGDETLTLHAGGLAEEKEDVAIAVLLLEERVGFVAEEEDGLLFRSVAGELLDPLFLH